jgi:hypothetical protein
MNCKCSELFHWLKKEISHLKELKQNLEPESKMHTILSAKIDAYLIILDGLSFE